MNAITRKSNGIAGDQRSVHLFAVEKRGNHSSHRAACCCRQWSVVEQWGFHESALNSAISREQAESGIAASFGWARPISEGSCQIFKSL